MYDYRGGGAFRVGVYYTPYLAYCCGMRPDKARRLAKELMCAGTSSSRKQQILHRFQHALYQSRNERQRAQLEYEWERAQLESCQFCSPYRKCFWCEEYQWLNDGPPQFSTRQLRRKRKRTRAASIIQRCWKHFRAVRRKQDVFMSILLGEVRRKPYVPQDVYMSMLLGEERVIVRRKECGDLQGLSLKDVEAAYAGVDAGGAGSTHARIGPPLNRPADSASLRAATNLRAVQRRVARIEKERNEAMTAASAAVGEVVPGARVSKLSTVDGRLLVVLDDAIDASDVDSARFALEHRAAFRRTERSVAEHPEVTHGVTEHDAEAFCATPLYRRIERLVTLFFSDRGFEPNRIYTNAMTFGDAAFMHRDAERVRRGEADNVTALLYPPEKWDTSLAGETIFFSEANDAIDAVLPRPGRLLLFTASIQHCGRPPSRLYWGQRFTLAIKFAARGPLEGGSDEEEGDDDDEGDGGLRLQANGGLDEVD